MNVWLYCEHISDPSATVQITWILEELLSFSYRGKLFLWLNPVESCDWKKKCPLHLIHTVGYKTLS